MKMMKMIKSRKNSGFFLLKIENETITKRINHAYRSILHDSVRCARHHTIPMPRIEDSSEVAERARRARRTRRETKERAERTRRATRTREERA
jgi:hypothetical protein